MVDECPSCGEQFKSCGKHWALSDCPYPELSDYQHDVVTGSLMGDGYVNDRNGRPRMTINMITKDYLVYLDSSVFGVLSNGVKKTKTADEAARQARRSLGRNISKENCHDVYRMRTVSHPDLREYSNWYSSGEKVFPDEISLTPTVLLHWFVGDGDYDTSGTNRKIRITTSNELEEKEKIMSYFENGPGIEPSNWVVSKRRDGSKNATLTFGVNESSKLFDYMEKSPDPTPLPGFEYKWPDNRQA